MEKWFCTNCGNKARTDERFICPNCGVKRYGESDEDRPAPKSPNLISRIIANARDQEMEEFDLEEQDGFSNEEILALGLYPKNDKHYKMSLISMILGNQRAGRK